LGRYEAEIDKGARDIGSARNGVERAAGYARRARGYGEKARYSRAFKLIAADEYRRLFALAVKDHDQAVQLDPGNAEMYVSRGLTYFDRARPAPPDDLDPKAGAKDWFDLAKADFTRAIERDGRHEQALDMRGMINEHNGDYDQAISDYTREMGLDPRAGKMRLADLYCNRGGVHQGAKRYESAISDYEKSLELGVASDGCSCDPYAPLAWVYFDGTRQYDKSWEVVHKAQAAKRWLPPEFIEQLKKASGRDK